MDLCIIYGESVRYSGCSYCSANLIHGYEVRSIGLLYIHSILVLDVNYLTDEAFPCAGVGKEALP